MLGSGHARRLALVSSALTALAIATAVLAPSAHASTRYVSNAKQFQSAVAAFRQSGGTIVLRKHIYSTTLVVGRRGTRRLTIVGTRGARVQLLELVQAQNVDVRDVSVHPLTGDGGIHAQSSRDITFFRDRFTAVFTRLAVTLDLDHSSHVLVSHNRFSHCADKTPEFNACMLPRHASYVTVDSNWFHDCSGCDFIGGRVGAAFTVENNRFARALACHEPWLKCGHSDDIELFQANGMLVRRNVFGVNQRGGAQLYMARNTDHVRIVNNLFLRHDPKAPGVIPRIGIQVGTRVNFSEPLDVQIVNNTVLSGRRTSKNQAVSIFLSPHYSLLPADERPLIVNTVMLRLDQPGIVCSHAGFLEDNVAGTSAGCPGVTAGDPGLTTNGRPTASSTLLIDQASRRWAPPRDLLGNRRVGLPDIGCFEYTP
jgi:hypothetical protein